MKINHLIKKFFGRSTLLALLAAWPLLVSADEAAGEAGNTLQLSGFATLGLTYNDNDTAGAVVSYTQKQPAEEGVSANLDSIVGAQLDWQALANTSFTLQGVARMGDDLEPKLRMGYWRQQFGEGVVMRIGRIRTPAFFDSDVTEIGYANLMVRPPLPLYSHINSIPALDGGDIQWRHAFGHTVMLMQTYYGNGKYEQANFTHGLLPFLADGEFEDTVGLAVNFILPNLTVRASHTRVANTITRSPLTDEINVGLGQLSGTVEAFSAFPLLPPATRLALVDQARRIDDFTNPFDCSVTYSSLGFDGNWDAWRFLGELIRIGTDSDVVGSYWGYQFTVGYTIGEFTPYFSLARLARKSSEIDPIAFAPTGLSPDLDTGLGQMQAALDQATQLHDPSTRSISIGVRWDFRENMALKIQYDRLKTPDSMSPGIFFVSGLPFDNEVNLYTIALEAVF